MPEVSGPRGRFGEAAAALALHAVLVVWLTWPLAPRAATHLPDTVGTCRFDTPLIAWILAHETHALATAPSTLPHGNQYHPAPNALFYGPTAFGALPLFAPVFLATGNPTPAINLTLLGGAALTAWMLHLVLVAATGSHAAGAVGGFAFLTTRWLFWDLVPTNPFYACLAPFPLIVAAAAAREVRVRRLLPLVVLQCLTDVAYVAAAVLAPLATIGLVRTARRATRRAGLRTLAVVLAAPVVLAPVYAGYAIVAARNPHIAEQTNWRGSGSPLFPWLGQHLTELPWGPFTELSPLTMAPIVLLVIAVGLAVAGVRGAGSEPARRLARHALVWTVIGIAVSLTPAVVWEGRVIRLPHAWLADWAPLRVLREPERLAIAALIGLSLLAGLAFHRCTTALNGRLRATAAAMLLVAIYVQYAWGFTVPFRRRPLPAAYPTVAVDTSPALVAALREGDGPVLELPVGPFGGVSPFFHVGALYRSTLHWRPLLNGYDGYWPAGFPERMALAGRLPDADALAELRRETGLTTIVVHQRLHVDATARAAWESLAASGGRDDLRLVRRIGDDLVFYCADPRLRLGSGGGARVGRMVARAGGVPRPAKPARQSRDAWCRLGAAS
jgi:hypothetical protein